MASALRDADSMTSVPEEEGSPGGRVIGRPRTVLVADDEHLVALHLCSALDDLGYEVIGPAADGSKAEELCAARRPDLALLDIRMPGRNGIATAATLYERWTIPTIIVSAYSEDGYIDESAKVGVHGFLVKPVTRDQLRAQIGVAWGKYQHQRELELEANELARRLEERKIIEQAKWHLVSTTGLSEPEALKLLQREARSRREPLVRLATRVLEGERFQPG